MAPLSPHKQQVRSFSVIHFILFFYFYLFFIDDIRTIVAINRHRKGIAAGTAFGGGRRISSHRAK